MTGATVSAVVPTLGRSPLMASALGALRRQRGATLEIVVVASGPKVLTPSPLADRWIARDEPLSFASATNLGIAAASGELIATINDDAVVASGWLEALTEALEGHPQAAAVQGINERESEPGTIDGCGLLWNDSWQVVQWLAGESRNDAPKAPREIFGVSATAALFRRQALAAISRGSAQPFEEALGSYYEDVELACRLRAAGWTSWLVPTALAAHAGSLTGEANGERIALVHRNRILVLARLLGSSFWPRLPKVLSRDLLDLGSELRSGRPDVAAQIARGVISGLRSLPRFSRHGAPHLLLAQLSRFRISS